MSWEGKSPVMNKNLNIIKQEGCIHVSTQTAEEGGARHRNTLSPESNCSRMIVLGPLVAQLLKSMSACAGELGLISDPGRFLAAEQLSP